MAKTSIEKKPPKPRRLTLKQRKWIKEYIKCGNATEAAEKVYNCKNRESAGSVGADCLQKLAMSDLMEKMGLTDVVLVNAGAEGMTQPMKIHGTGDNFVEMPDYGVRHKYWDTLLKLKGKMKDGPKSLTQVNYFEQAAKNAREIIEGNEL